MVTQNCPGQTQNTIEQASSSPDRDPASVISDLLGGPILGEQPSTASGITAPNSENPATQNASDPESVVANLLHPDERETPGIAVPQGMEESSPAGRTPSVNTQYEDPDHPSLPTSTDFGKAQQDAPLYKWSPNVPVQDKEYCRDQPNIACQIPFPGSEKQQFERPAAVTSPAMPADCDVLQASWQRTVNEAARNHEACLAYYKGAGREGAAGLQSACTFAACQQVHNSLYRANALQQSEVQQCRQSLATPQQ